jgi:RNA polymerase sigma factor (sigma-70 family)
MPAALFPTTRRSVVLALASDDQALRVRAFDTLVAIYWKPLYKHARLSRNRTREEAEDLVQGFFMRALEKESLASYDPQKAGFRTFLRLLFDRHAANEEKAAGREKRGGSNLHLDFDLAEAELAKNAVTTGDPETCFRQEWARSLFTLALDRLRARCEAEGKSTHYQIFESYDLEGDRSLSYRELADRYGIAETQVTNHLAAMRRQFRSLVLEAIGEVTASEQEYRAEVRALLGDLR